VEFSNDELKVIGAVQRILRSYRRGISTLQEVVIGVISEIALADTARITPHCLALLPAEARPNVEACVDRLAASDYRDDLVLWVGAGPSEEKRERLRQRNRAICERIIEYYRRFDDRAVPPRELEVPEVDSFWETLRGMRMEGGPTCRMEGCDQPTVRVSVFCARHHYESIEGKPPPDY
jgi:hypothetical protein